MNLREKLLAISDEVGAIKKTGRNTNQGYDFIEQSELVSHLRPLFSKHKLAIIPSMTGHELVQKEKGFKVITKYAFLLCDAESSDSVEVEWYGEADDSLDKATNKASTAAQKYFYMRLFNISDKDDPDGESPDTGKGVEDKISTAQRGKIFATLKDKGYATTEEQKEIIEFLTGNASTADLNKADASKLIKNIEELGEKHDPEVQA